MTTDRRPSPWSRGWPFAFIVLGAIVFGTLIGGRVVYRPFNAPSAAMEPTLNVGDLFLVSVFAYLSDAPARGDVIVFRGAKGTYYIKRVVGLPGDRVQMIDGVLYIDGKAVPKRRVADRVETDDFGVTSRVPQFEETLPDGRAYYVLDRGETKEDNTQAFLVPADSYFVLGDNRDNSDDSRLSMGYIARSAIVGRATTVYFTGGKLVWRNIR
jgi:signal peptidase I